MKVAWFGHKSRERGDGLITYSKEITKGLKTRGAGVIFFYHGDRDVGGSGSVRLGSFNIFDHDIISRPGARNLIEKTLEREKVDVAHASLSFSLLDFNLPEICHQKGVPIVATLHFPYDRRPTLLGGGSRVLYRLWSGPLSKYDAVIIFSREQKDLLAEYGVSRERICVIPNGVDVDFFSPGPSRYKEEIGADFVVAYWGRIDPEKRVEALLRVFYDLELPPSCKAVVLGEGVGYDRLRRRYRGPQIIFTGLVLDRRRLLDILRGCDVFVLPSEVEGLSLSLLEAMACGLTPVATDVGCHGEVLDGVGLLIDPSEVEIQLKLALRLLVEHPEIRTLLGEKARQRVVERYSLSNNIDRVMGVYKGLIERTLLS
jgi:glycosyltransferase involved in cell wall biosynthesis